VLGDIVHVIADHCQWFAEDRTHRLFAPELGGGALLDLGIYPVSFASMVLGEPNRLEAIADPAFTGVDAQTSILLGYESGAHALLNCTLRAVGSTRASIVGTDARIEIDGAFYQPVSFTLIPREGEPQRFFDPPAEGGLRHEADEAARCIEAGELESPEMPLDETVAIMRTMDAVMAAGAAR
jgi:predicted dehydrogenase